MSLLNLFSLEKKDSNIDLGTTTIYSYLESVNILKLLIRLKELACELWIRKGYELRVEVFWLLHQNKSPLTGAALSVSTAPYLSSCKCRGP